MDIFQLLSIIPFKYYLLCIVVAAIVWVVVSVLTHDSRLGCAVAAGAAGLVILGFGALVGLDVPSGHAAFFFHLFAVFGVIPFGAILTLAGLVSVLARSQGQHRETVKVLIGLLICGVVALYAAIIVPNW